MTFSCFFKPEGMNNPDFSMKKTIMIFPAAGHEKNKKNARRLDFA